MTHDSAMAAPQASRSADAPAACQVTSQPEIARLLGELIDGAVPVMLTGPEGLGFTTALWSIDAQGERASFGADAQDARLRQLVDGDEIVAVAHLDHVKLQFELHHPILVSGTHACVLQTQLPRTLFRFQRRGSFRVRSNPRSSPLLRMRHPSIPEMQLALRLLDLSAGGCALLLPADVPPLQPGTRLQQVRVELDLATRFDADIVLRHVGSGDDGSGQRLGCEWTRLDAAARCTLQRYIDDTQRRQRPLWRP